LNEIWKKYNAINERGEEMRNERAEIGWKDGGEGREILRSFTSLRKSCLVRRESSGGPGREVASKLSSIMG
jgi:hypothetical protein